MIKKTNKFIGVMIILSMLLSAIPTFVIAAEAGTTFTADDFIYKVNTDTSTVTLASIAATMLTGEVTVPETVSDGTSTYMVTHLGDAFKNQGAKTEGMTSLVLPDTMTNFTGTATFYACKGLESIHLPKNLIKDGSSGYGNCLYNTFQYCTKLTSVILPASITACVETFQNSGVKTITITGMNTVSFYCDSGTASARAWAAGTTGITIYYPENGTTPTRITGNNIGITAISQDIEPEESDVPEESPYLYSIKSEEEKTIVITGGKAGKVLSGAVTIPSEIDGYTVVALGDAAFGRGLFKNVTSVTIPDTVKRIESNNCFYDCKNIQEIILPEEMDYIGVGAFTGCTALTSIVIPNGVTQLSKTFRRCTSLKTVTIPTSVTEMDAAVFASTNDGTDVMPGITIKCAIGSYADQYAKSRGINVKYSEGPLYTYTDNGDDSITITAMADDVEIVGTLEIPKSIDGKIVTGIGDGAFRGRVDITGITLPETIYAIGAEAFANCSNIRVFDIPDGVETLDNTFLGCTSLSVVTIPESVTNIGDSTFYTDYEANGGLPIFGLTIYCMEGSVAQEYATEHGFSYEAERRVPDPWDGTVDTTWYDSAEDTYYISDASQLAGLRHLVNTGAELFYGKTVNLTSDINMEESVWKVGIGYYTATTADERAFNGIFNGNEFIIYNLTYDTTASDDSVSDVIMPNVESHHYHGLFGVLGTYGKIKNLGVENAHFTIGSPEYKVTINSGVLAGNNKGEINHCYVNNTKFDGGYYGSFCDQLFGGISGGNSGRIEDCFVKTIDFTDLVAQYNSGRKSAITPSSSGAIKDCYAAGIIYDNGNGYYTWNEDGTGKDKCPKMFYYDSIVSSNSGTVENVYSDDGFTRNGWSVGVRTYEGFTSITDRMNSAMEKLTFRTIAAAETKITIQKADGDLVGIRPEVQIEFTQPVDAQALTEITLKCGDEVLNTCNITNLNDAQYPTICTLTFRDELIWGTEYELIIGGVKDLWNRELITESFTFKTAKEIVYQEFALYENYGVAGERKLTSLEGVSGTVTAVIKGLRNNGTESYNAVFGVSTLSDGHILKGAAKLVNIAPNETKSSPVIVGNIDMSTATATDIEIQAALYKGFEKVVPLIKSVQASR